MAKIYQLNLIDTPGHVDFSYEVSRSLAACEGALLVVDASQGVEAQTLANSYLAINHGLEIIPVINKIDLQSADVARTKEMIESAVGLDASDALLISAKTGQGVPDVLEAIVKRVPPPKGAPERHLQALLFDSWFDPYRGVVVLARVFEGRLRKGQKIRLWSNGHVFQVETLGVLTPETGGESTNWWRAKLDSSSRISRTSRIRRSATPSPTMTGRRCRHCRGLKKSSPWFSPDCTR